MKGTVIPGSRLRTVRASVLAIGLAAVAFGTASLGAAADETSGWANARRIARDSKKEGWLPGTTIMRVYTVEAGGRLELRGETTVFRRKNSAGEIETTIVTDASGSSEVQDGRDYEEQAGPPDREGARYGGVSRPHGGNDEMSRHMQYLFVEGGPFAARPGGATTVTPRGDQVTRNYLLKRYSFVYLPSNGPGMEGTVWVRADNGAPARLLATARDSLGRMENVAYDVRYNAEPGRWYPTSIRIDGTVRVFLFIKKDFRMNMTLAEYFRTDPEKAERSLLWQ